MTPDQPPPPARGHNARRPGARAIQEANNKTRSSIFQRYKRNASNLLLERRLIVPLLTVLVILITPAVVFFVHPSVRGAVSGGRDATIRLRQDASSTSADGGGEMGDSKGKTETPAKKCYPSPLWDHTVDDSRYEYGCPEIKQMLDGKKKLLGSGNIREVFLVDYHGRKFVLKTLREDFVATALRTTKMHRWEAAALDAVRGHPNIVGLLGSCGTTHLSEYLPTSLDELVLASDELLPIERVVQIARDAARGLQGLHEVPGGAVVHFDLKPHQLMIGVNGMVKINDLNMCRFTGIDEDGETCPFTESHASRPGPWRSPENIAGEPLTEKLDIYSMAMVFYSMLAGHPPFEGEKGALKKIMNGIPPKVDRSWNRDFMDIIRDMWKRDPAERPSARELVERLEALEKDLNVSPDDGDDESGEEEALLSRLRG